MSKRVRVTPEGSATELKVLWREDWSQGKQLAAQHSMRTERLQAWVTFIRAHCIILEKGYQKGSSGGRIGERGKGFYMELKMVLPGNKKGFFKGFSYGDSRRAL